MLLKEKISKDIITAMKAKDDATRDVLRVLKGEIYLSQSNTDDEVISQIQRFINNIKDTNPDSQEISILEVYLPQSLSEDEIRTIVKREIETSGYTSQKDMKHLMEYFKTNHHGSFEGKTLSIIVREELNS